MCKLPDAFVGICEYMINALIACQHVCGCFCVVLMLFCLCVRVFVCVSVCLYVCLCVYVSVRERIGLM